jgi:drug/metabolite transporter (DMT)-like permease
VPILAIALALTSALVHAAWNALLKAGTDRLVDSALVAFGWAAFGAALIAVAGPPPPATYMFLLGSAIAHAFYWAALTKGYDMGDLSHVYTLSRGSAPALVTLGAALAVHEIPQPLALAGIALVTFGILIVGASPHAPLKATGWALLIGVTIASYSLIDAFGARVSGKPASYVGATLMIDAVPIGAFCLWRRGPARLFADARRNWRRGLTAGLVSGAGYGLVLWAQTLAKVGQVSALRETSVVFAALIAWIVLRERLGLRRALGAGIVAAGAVLIGII